MIRGQGPPKKAKYHAAGPTRKKDKREALPGVWSSVVHLLFARNACVYVCKGSVGCGWRICQPSAGWLIIFLRAPGFGIPLGIVAKREKMIKF
ncbi:hypothetical protein LSM04_001611 [Trypanosoma melophagium]|uniref:uncharacterized protein n=1 Tax=Trypanosoma melophagium TaxID=715481 RepID=UPI00351A8DFF|nr:hypothetical protein LSM04_001611 [Trypanosoma melophagium]